MHGSLQDEMAITFSTSSSLPGDYYGGATPLALNHKFTQNPNPKLIGPSCLLTSMRRLLHKIWTLEQFSEKARSQFRLTTV